MNPIQDLIVNFQNLVAQVPEFLQPVILMLAGAVPFIEGEGGAIIGVVGGVNPIVAAIAAALGNFLSVLAVVFFSSSARSAVVDRRKVRVNEPVRTSRGTTTGQVAVLEAETAVESPPAKPESKGRQRFKRWVVRFGVPGASILGPLAIPTQFTSAILIASGTSRAWVLLWQAVAILIWTTVATVSVWLALQVVVGG